MEAAVYLATLFWSVDRYLKLISICPRSTKFLWIENTLNTGGAQGAQCSIIPEIVLPEKLKKYIYNKYTNSFVSMAKLFREGIWVSWSALLVGVWTHLQPMWKKDFRWVQKYSSRIMGYRVCQLILSHNTILIIGEWQSLQIKRFG